MAAVAAWPAHPGQMMLQANQTFRPGETIINRDPCVFLVSGDPGQGEIRFWRDEWRAVGIGGPIPAGYTAKILAAHNNLNAGQQNIFNSLATNTAHAAFPANQQMVSRVQANAFAGKELRVPTAGGGHTFILHFLAYKTIARANHSCIPNAAIDINWRRYVGDLANGRPTATMRALTHINQNDEITIDYKAHNDFPLVATRRADLQSTYGFACTCPSCTNANASDARRNLISATLRDPALQLRDHPDYRRTIRQVCDYNDIRRVRAYKNAVLEEGIRDGRLGNAYYIWADVLKKSRPPSLGGALEAVRDAETIFRNCYGSKHKETEAQDRRKREIEADIHLAEITVGMGTARLGPI